MLRETIGSKENEVGSYIVAYDLTRNLWSYIGYIRLFRTVNSKGERNAFRICVKKLLGVRPLGEMENVE
jgi:hypothetical protein